MSQGPLVDQFRELSRAALSEAIGPLKIVGHSHGLPPLDFRWRMVGRAFTGQYRPCGMVGGTVGDFFNSVPAGAVVRGVGGHFEPPGSSAAGGLDGDLGAAETWGTAGNWTIRSSALGHYTRTGRDRVQVVPLYEPVTAAEA